MKKPLVIIVAVLVVGLFVWYLMSGRDGDEQVVESTSIERGTVEHVVNVTGYVEPFERLLLAFTQGGHIQSLPVEEGDRVGEGELLATLDSGVANASVAEAEARVRREEAVLRELVAPARDAEIAVKRAAVVQAEATLSRAEANAVAVLAKAYTQADDAVREELDEVFEDNTPGNYKFGVKFAYGTKQFVITTDSQTESELASTRADVDQTLAGLQARSSAATQDVYSALRAAEADIIAIEDFASRVAQVINEYISTDLTSQSVYETFQTSVATARTALATTRGEIVAAETSLSNADTALDAAKRSLELTLADPKNATVLAQEAAIRAAEASGAGAAETLYKTQLAAPIAGVVSRISYERGEAVAPYEAVVELISPESFELEAYIPEADIAQVKLGDRAQVTFDAFERSDIYDAEVVRIALSETVREGVPTYKTTLVLLTTKEDKVLRSGMTADIDILTDTRDNVLFVPTRSVLRDGDGHYVRIKKGSGIEERRVTVGLRGSEGYTEIRDGVMEGEEVVLFIEDE
jgi:HlyD family secretion protein